MRGPERFVQTRRHDYSTSCTKDLHIQVSTFVIQ